MPPKVPTRGFEETKHESHSYAESDYNERQNNTISPNRKISRHEKSFTSGKQISSKHEFLASPKKLSEAHLKNLPAQYDRQDPDVSPKRSKNSAASRKNSDASVNYPPAEAKERKALQQSRSAFDILRAKPNATHNRLHSELIGSAELAKHNDLQSGNDWTCMWLNHFNREERQSEIRNSKYALNSSRILANPEKFGTEYNNVNEIKKAQIREAFLGKGCGNEFVAGMSGCPIEKVHKLKTKKREKLKKYLLANGMETQPFYQKSMLQNGKGVSIDPTPDYNFYRIVDEEKRKFKNEIEVSLELIATTG